MGQSSESSKVTTAASTVVVGLAIISVALRFYTRMHFKAGVAADDWWILGGLLLTIVSGSLLLYGMLARAPTISLKLVANSNKAPSLIHMAER